MTVTSATPSRTLAPYPLCIAIYVVVMIACTVSRAYTNDDDRAAPEVLPSESRMNFTC